MNRPEVRSSSRPVLLLTYFLSGIATHFLWHAEGYDASQEPTFSSGVLQLKV